MTNTCVRVCVCLHSPVLLSCHNWSHVLSFLFSHQIAKFSCKQRTCWKTENEKSFETDHVPTWARSYSRFPPGNPTPTHHPPTQVSGVLSDWLTFYPLNRAKGNRWLVSTSSVRGRRSLIWWTKQPCGWWCNRVQTAGFQISKSKEKLINAELIPTETRFKHD